MNVDANQIAALEASIVGARQSGDKGYEADLMEELAEARIPDGDDLVENWAYSGAGLDFEREAERRREDAREGVRRIESAAVRAYLAGLGQAPSSVSSPELVRLDANSGPSRRGRVWRDKDGDLWRASNRDTLYPILSSGDRIARRPSVRRAYLVARLGPLTSVDAETERLSR